MSCDDDDDEAIERHCGSIIPKSRWIIVPCGLCGVFHGYEKPITVTKDFDHWKALNTCPTSLKWNLKGAGVGFIRFRVIDFELLKTTCTGFQLDSTVKSLQYQFPILKTLSSSAASCEVVPPPPPPPSPSAPPSNGLNKPNLKTILHRISITAVSSSSSASITTTSSAETKYAAFQKQRRQREQTLQSIYEMDEYHDRQTSIAIQNSLSPTTTTSSMKEMDQLRDAADRSFAASLVRPDLYCAQHGHYFWAAGGPTRGCPRCIDAANSRTISRFETPTTSTSSVSSLLFK